MPIVSTNIGGACIEEEDVCMVGTFSYYHWMASKRTEEREGEQERTMVVALEEPSSMSTDLKERTMVVALECDLGTGIERRNMSCCFLCL
jgi:hypothetical protein